MIISRTPMRVSFAGGGTDLRSFYRHEPGLVVSTAINKYVYITVNRAFDRNIRVSYSETEIVDHVSKVRHNLIREAMKLSGVTEGVEITSIADIPSKGTGLGSSSSYTVGLLNALYAYKGEFKSAKALAEEACRIEIHILGEPIGKQDQYIAAFGGLQRIQFNPDEMVFVDPIICHRSTKEALSGNLMLFYTGLTRSARTILTRQRRQTKKKLEALRKMKAWAVKIEQCLASNRNLNRIGRYLHENWDLKKTLAGGITNPQIERWYGRAMESGAIGGKLLGAGGGGFLLFYAEEQNHWRVREALSDLQEMPIELEPQGSKIIYVED